MTCNSGDDACAASSAEEIGTTSGNALSCNASTFDKVVNNPAGSGLVTSRTGEQLLALSDLKISGLIPFDTLAELNAYTPANTFEERSGFLVTNDPVSSNNGTWTWVTGTTYLQASKTVVNVIEESNTFEGVSGFAVYQGINERFSLDRFPFSDSKFIQPSNGEVGNTTTDFECTEDFIKVDGEDLLYTAYANIRFVGFYDEDKVFISGFDPDTDTITIPVNAEYFRWTRDTSPNPRASISFVGNVLEKIETNESKIASLEALEVTVGENSNYLENSFSKYYKNINVSEEADLEGFLDKTTGNFTSLPGGAFRTTGFYTIDTSINYFVNIKADANIAAVYYYDESQVFVGIEFGDTSSLVSENLAQPAGSAFMRFSYSINDTFNINSEVLASNANSEYEFLNLDYVNQEGFISRSTGQFTANAAWRSVEIDLTAQSLPLYVDSEVEVAQTTIAVVVYVDENENVIGYQGDFDDTLNRPNARKLQLTPPLNAKYARVTSQNVKEVQVFTDLVSEREDIKRAKVDYYPFGDSITQGVGSTGDKGSYAVRFAKNNGFSFFTNRGVSSARVIKTDAGTSDDLVLFDKTSALAGFAGMITVAIGVNDFDNQNPIGNARDTIKKTLASISDIYTYNPAYTFADGFRFTMETLRLDNPDADIYCLMPINYDKEWDTDQSILFDQYRDIEREICIYLGIKVIEMQHCGISSYDQSLYYFDNGGGPDGLHPNDYGHDLMADYLTRQVRFKDITSY